MAKENKPSDGEKKDNSESDSKPDTPATPDTPKEPKKPSYSPALNFSEAKTLNKKLEPAEELQAEYQALAQNNPRGLEPFFMEHLKSVGGSIEPFEKPIERIKKSGNYEAFAQLGQKIIAETYGKEIINYQNALRDKTGRILEGAPENVFKFIVGRATKTNIEKLVDEHNLAKEHLQLKTYEDLMQKAQSQSDEGDKARKTIRDKFNAKYRESYKGIEGIFDAFTDMLQADIAEYADEFKELQKKIVKEATEDRPYAAAVAGKDLSEIISAEFAGRLPEEYSQAA